MTGVEREKREWWVIVEGRVSREAGWSCAPNNPDCWWFPQLGFSGSEGHQVFDNRAEAVQHALDRLGIERREIDRKISHLQGEKA